MIPNGAVGIPSTAMRAEADRVNGLQMRTQALQAAASVHHATGAPSLVVLGDAAAYARFIDTGTIG